MSEGLMLLQLDPLDHHFDPEGQAPTLWARTSWSTGSQGRQGCTPPSPWHFLAGPLTPTPLPRVQGRGAVQGVRKLWAHQPASAYNQGRGFQTPCIVPLGLIRVVKA